MVMAESEGQSGGLSAALLVGARGSGDADAGVLEPAPEVVDVFGLGRRLDDLLIEGEKVSESAMGSRRSAPDLEVLRAIARTNAFSTMWSGTPRLCSVRAVRRSSRRIRPRVPGSVR